MKAQDHSARHDSCGLLERSSCDWGRGPDADLLSGVYHWGVDNYGDGSTPVFGSQIAGFQVRSAFDRIQQIEQVQ